MLGKYGGCMKGLNEIGQMYDQGNQYLQQKLFLAGSECRNCHLGKGSQGELDSPSRWTGSLSTRN